MMVIMVSEIAIGWVCHASHALIVDSGMCLLTVGTDLDAPKTWSILRIPVHCLHKPSIS